MGTTLVGTERQEIVLRLLAAFDAVASGAGPIAVSLESPLGLGKTRLVQELYRGLAATRQGPTPYWPESLTDGGQRLLQARKQVEPVSGWVAPGGVEIPWLWWGVSCRVSYAGSPMRAMKDASDQLRPHVDAMRSKLERGHHRDDALELLAGLFDLVGVVNPGAAADAGAKFLGVWRRKRDRKRQAAAASMDRRIDAHVESYEEAGRIADSLTAVARAGTPAVLAVDDAQWADPALVSLLRHVVGLEAAPVLIITTSWREAVPSAVASRADSFDHWLETTAVSRPQHLTRIELGRLPDEALTEMVLEAASKTEPAAAAAVARIASGNPLVLSLLLDLDVVRRDVDADSSIDIDPEDLRRLPSDLRAIYQDLWGQLSEPVRRALALCAAQGPEFLPGFVEVAATRLGMHREVMAALADARGGLGWVRAVNETRSEFAERQRFEIAADNVPTVFSTEDQDLIRSALVDFVEGLKATPSWPDLDQRTCRLALESHLEASEDLADEAPRAFAALADSSLQLAVMDLDAGDATTAVGRAETAVGLLDDVGDEAARTRARAVLAQALTLAGRGTDAVSLLVEAVDTASTQGGARAAEVIDLINEIEEEVASQPDAVPEVLEPTGDGTGDAWGRVDWHGWVSHAVPWITDLTPTDLGELICEVVAAEGPVLAGRVYTLLRSASGASKAGRNIRAALDAGVRTAARRGDLRVSTTGARGTSERRVLWLPSQPEVLLRLRGERDAWSIPQNELAELARRVVAADPDLSRDEAKRRLAHSLGAKRYSKPLDELLEEVLPASIGTSTMPASKSPADDVIRSHAVDQGVADGYDAFIAVAHRAGLGLRFWPLSVTLTPPADRRITLVYLQPIEGSLYVEAVAANFTKFFGIDAVHVVSALGGEGQRLSVSEAVAASERLERLLLIGDGGDAAMPAQTATPVVEGVTVDEWGRAPFVAWTPHPIPSLTDLTRAEIVELLCEVTSAEGPVMAGRAWGLLREASGANRLGAAIRDALDDATRTAIRNGDLLVERFMPETEWAVLRRPDQPAVILREPGERETWSIPPNEIADLATRILAARPAATRAELKRELAAALGWRRYTTVLDEHLEWALPKALGG